MKNKKLVLSVLSTAVVASMASSAFAAPKAGLYFNQSGTFYNLTDILKLNTSAYAEFKTKVSTSDRNQIVFVKADGKGASVQEILTEENAWNEALVESDFAASYNVIGTDGSVTGTYDARKDVTPAPTGDLKVESVSAINSSQIQLKFSANVDKKSAEEASNYTIKAGASTIAAKPTLVDSKTVVLTIDPKDAVSNNLNQATLDVTASEIKSATDSSKKIPAYSGKVTILDLSVPQAVDAKLIGPGLIQVNFSEPVYVASGVGFLIDGGQYSVSVKESDPTTKSVTLQTGSLTMGNHTITVNPDGDKALKDGAGLLVTKADVPLVVSEDKTAPALVSGTVSSQNEVVLTFDEPVAGLAKESVYHTANTSAYQASNVVEVVGSNKKQWRVTFANPLPTGNLTLYVAKEAVQDNFGNKNSQVLNTTVSVVSDTIKPTVTELKVVNASRVTLAFSEDVTGADNKASYRVTDGNGNLVSGYSVSYSAADKKATLTFNPVLKEGVTYNVEVTGVKDKAVVPNEMDRYSSSFSVSDLSAPTVTENGIYDKTARKLTVFFSEPMNGTDLLDKGKYTLVAGSVQVALPSDAVVALGANNTSVAISLPAVIKDNNGDDVSSKINQIIVGQLRDLAGNKTAKVFTTVSLESTAGTITDANVISSSAVTVDTRTVQFALNKPLKTIDAKDFTVNGDAVEFAKYENKTLSDGKTYGSVITLQVAAADKWTTDAVPSIVTTDNPKSESQYGDKFASKATLVSKVADGVAPALADVNNDNAVDGKDLGINRNSKGEIDKVTVSFTEALKQSTISIEDFDVPGYSVGDVKLVDDEKVEVTLKTPAEAGTSFSVRYVGSISDVLGNTYAAGTSGFEFKIGAEQNPQNNAPTVAKAIDDAKATIGTDKEVDASGTFADTDNDKLTLSAKSSDEKKATVAVSGSKLTIKPLEAGEVTITVTAEDGNGGTVTDEFKVTVEAATVDKAALNTEITEAEGLTEADYTAESWDVVEAALADAKKVKDDADTTQEEVDQATKKLEDAVADLVKKPAN